MQTRYGTLLGIIIFWALLGKLQAATVNLNGTISTNTTLYSTNIYKVTGNVTVNSGVILTVQAGTIIKFSGVYSITVNGSLQAVGTAGTEIYFTSWKDDLIGGDTNGDGGATSPAVGDWNMISANTSSTVNLQYCQIRYGGSTSTSGSVNANSPSSLTIAHCIIEQSKYRGIKANHASGTGTWSITDNIIKTSGSYGAELSPTAANLSLTFSGNTFENNTAAGVLVPITVDVSGNAFSGGGNLVGYSGSSLAADTTLQLPAGAGGYYLTGSLTVPAGRTLTIPAGTVIKFKALTSGSIVVDGTLVAVGTEQNRIYFTSSRDTSADVGGAVNNETIAAAKGNWHSVRGTTNASMQFKYCTVRYAGGSASYGAIYGGTVSQLTVENSNISDSSSWGVFGNVSTNGVLTLKDSTVSSCGTAGYTGIAAVELNNTSSLVISGNTLSNNVGVGLYVPPDIDLSTNTYVGTNGLSNLVRLKVLTLTRDATWATPADSAGFLMTGNITVPAGKTLTIPAGTIVKLRAGQTVSLIASGTVTAIGDTNNRIYFTSTRDTDAALGGAVQSETIAPATGDWHYIGAASGGNLNLKYCETRYGGGNASSSGSVYGDFPETLFVENCTISKSKYAGVKFTSAGISTTTFVCQNNLIKDGDSYGMDLAENGSGELNSTITGNTIQNNVGAGFYVSPGYDVKSNTYSGTNGLGNAVVFKTGNVNRSLVWQLPTGAAYYYVEGAATVASARTLTIPSGTKVKFKAGTTARIEVNNSASLVAEGTASARIYFTSSRDTASDVGGAVPGESIAAAAGDWHYVNSKTSSSMKLKYCDIRYGGNPANYGAVTTQNSKQLIVENCNVISSLRKGILPTLEANATVSIRANLIKSCGEDGLDLATTSTMSVRVESNTLESNTGAGLFISPDIDIASNSYVGTNGLGNAVKFKAASTVSRDLTWTLASGAAFYYLDGSVTIASGKSVVVPAGTIIKAKAGASAQLNVLGSLSMDGTSQNRVYLTSSRDTDSAVGGAVPGESIAAARGNWRNIATSSTSSLQMKYCTVRYGGDSSTGTIDAGQLPTLAIDNCLITESLYRGVYLDSPSNTANWRFTNTTVSNSSGTGLYVRSGVYKAFAVFLANNFTNNGAYGVDLVSETWALINSNVTGNTTGGANAGASAGADMRVCWWGNASGPSGIGPGTGATAAGAILFNPWRQAAVATTPLVRAARFDGDSFNPGDTNGIGQVYMSSEFDENSNWTITIKDSGGTTVRTFTGTGTGFAQAWDGTDTGSTIVAQGTYTVDINVTPTATPARAEDLRGIVVVNTSKAIVNITAPSDGQLIKAGDQLTVSGVVKQFSSGDVITTYDLYYGYGSAPIAWTSITSQTYSTPVNGTITSFTVPAQSSANLTIRLRANMSGGVSREARVTLAYLSAPLATLNLFSPNNDGKLDTTTISNFIGSAVGWTLNIKDDTSTTVRSVALGISNTVSYSWDGKNNSGVTLADGVYTATLDAAGSVNTLTTSSITAEIDNTAPQATISSPASSAIVSGRSSVVGTATDSNFTKYTLEYGSGSSPVFYTVIAQSTSPISASELGLWDTYPLAIGTYSIKLSTEDAAGNTNSATVTVDVDRIEFSSVSPSTEFSAVNGESGVINFVLNKPATVTAAYHRVTWTTTSNFSFDTSVINPVPTRTITDTFSVSGAASISWNGRTGSNPTDPIADNGCYLVKLTATQAGTTLAGEHDPSYDHGYVYDVSVGRIVHPLEVNASSTPFKSAAGEGWAVTYRFMKSAFTSILAFQGTRAGNIITDSPRPIGVHTDIWDGRYAPDLPSGGQLVPQANYTMYIMALETPVNSIILNNKFVITDVAAEQYRILETYDHVSTIKYTLSHTSTVSVVIKDPNNNVFRTLRSHLDGSQTAGAKTLEWDGTNDSGRIIDTEGIYFISIQAIDANSNVSTTAKGVIQVYK